MEIPYCPSNSRLQQCPPKIKLLLEFEALFGAAPGGFGSLHKGTVQKCLTPDSKTAPVLAKLN